MSTVLCAEENGEQRGPGRQPGRGPGWSPWFTWARGGDPAAGSAAQVSGGCRCAAGTPSVLHGLLPQPPNPGKGHPPPAEASRLWGG